MVLGQVARTKRYTDIIAENGGFSLTGDMLKTTTASFFILCVVFNLINADYSSDAYFLSCYDNIYK
ncbi:MAG: hypothetical protein A2Y15_08250 [Clostridiales bacterium GWF2_36_10]|nr:MAG: hypothetical protein A2Y15_08250 [Clostridiales bacterium GWF2_36_10]HAN21040.1 hypothetical protein [Clostridiales bacterium]